MTSRIYRETYVARSDGIVDPWTAHLQGIHQDPESSPMAYRKAHVDHRCSHVCTLSSGLCWIQDAMKSFIERST